MGNTSVSLTNSLEDFFKSDEITEEVLEPLQREGIICEVSEGLAAVIFEQALEIIAVASVATIRYAATSEDSGEDVFDDYDVEFNEIDAYNLFEDFN